MKKSTFIPLVAMYILAYIAGDLFYYAIHGTSILTRALGVAQ
jgi:hypothetical protein